MGWASGFLEKKWNYRVRIYLICQNVISFLHECNISMISFLHCCYFVAKLVIKKQLPYL